LPTAIGTCLGEEFVFRFGDPKSWKICQLSRKQKVLAIRPNDKKPSQKTASHIALSVLLHIA